MALIQKGSGSDIDLSQGLIFNNYEIRENINTGELEINTNGLDILRFDTNRNLFFHNNLTGPNLYSTIQTPAQPNITSLGTLTELNVNGLSNFNNNNIININTVSATQLAGTIVVPNQPVISALGVQSQALDMGNNNIVNVNTVSATQLAGTIVVPNQPIISGLGVQSQTLDMGNNNINNVNTIIATNLSGTIVVPNQPNIVSLGTQAQPLNMGNNNINNVNILGAQTINTTTLNGTNIVGTIITPAQPNITSLGTLTGLNVNGTSDFNGNNLINVGNLSVFGTLTANNAIITTTLTTNSIGTTSLTANDIVAEKLTITNFLDMNERTINRINQLSLKGLGTVYYSSIRVNELFGNLEYRCDSNNGTIAHDFRNTSNVQIFGIQNDGQLTITNNSNFSNSSLTNINSITSTSLTSGSGLINNDLQVNGNIGVGVIPKTGLHILKNNCHTLLNIHLQLGVSPTLYYPVAQVRNDLGGLRLHGLIGGHEIAQGRTFVDLGFWGRGQFDVCGQIIGDLGNVDLMVYFNNNRYTIYLYLGNYAQINLSLENTFGDILWDGTGSATTPVGTLSYQLSTGVGGTNIIKQPLNGNVEFNKSGGELSLRNTTGYMSLGDNTGSILYTRNGNVGIGESNPLQKLHVNGGTYLVDNVGIGESNPINKLHVNGGTYLVGNVGIGTNNTSPLTKFYVSGNTILSGNLAVSQNTSLGAAVTPTKPLEVYGESYLLGNVGINVFNPSSQLHVVGDTLLEGNFNVNNGLIRTIIGNNAVSINALPDPAYSLYLERTTPVVGIKHMGGLTSYGEPALNLIKLNSRGYDQVWIQFYRSEIILEGDIRINGAGNLVFQDASDGRLKENIIEYENGYNKIKQLRTVEYEWIDTQKKNELGRIVGFIAQEVELVLPKAVGKMKPTHKTNPDNEEEIYGIHRTEMIPFMWSALRKIINDKEQLENDFLLATTQISNLQNDLTTANNKITSLENDLTTANNNITSLQNDLLLLTTRINRLEGFHPGNPDPDPNPPNP